MRVTCNSERRGRAMVIHDWGRMNAARRLNRVTLSRSLYVRAVCVH